MNTRFTVDNVNLSFGAIIGESARIVLRRLVSPHFPMLQCTEGWSHMMEAIENIFPLICCRYLFAIAHSAAMVSMLTCAERASASLSIRGGTADLLRSYKFDSELCISYSTADPLYLPIRSVRAVMYVAGQERRQLIVILRSLQMRATSSCIDR
jgi:hypothetical protein